MWLAIYMKLVASTEDANVYRGVIAANAAGDTGFFGDATFRWTVSSPYNMRASFSKTALGSRSACEFMGQGFTAAMNTLISNWIGPQAEMMARPLATITHQGTPGLEANKVGDSFDITVYSDNAYSVSQGIHGDSRWEQYLRTPNILAQLPYASSNSDGIITKAQSEQLDGAISASTLHDTPHVKQCVISFR